MLADMIGATRKARGRLYRLHPRQGVTREFHGVLIESTPIELAEDVTLTNRQAALTAPADLPAHEGDEVRDVDTGARWLVHAVGVDGPAALMELRDVA